MSPSQVREFTQELTSQPALPDVPNSLWADLAAKHSVFGKLVLSSHLDVAQAIDHVHINEAAKGASVAPDQIDAAVESLSEYLGWDITKGLGAT